VVDPLAVAKASPEAVARLDKSAWLSLFTPDAIVEDPVGTEPHAGEDRISSFWDVFIAPYRVTFLPRRDFTDGGLVMRQVTISTVTDVDRDPLLIPAIIEYEIRDERIASLRAIWELRRAVGWYARHGARGVGGLLRHGARMTKRLGLGSSMGFGRALVPQLSTSEGQAFAERLVRALPSFSAWHDLLGGDIRTKTEPICRRLHDCKATCDPSSVVVAGDHFACVLEGTDTSAALIARVAKSRLTSLRVAWSP